jgi:serine/threonine protein kinase
MYANIHIICRWLSPEIRLGADPTPSSDIFSLGLVMWQFVTKELPLAELGMYILNTHIFTCVLIYIYLSFPDSYSAGSRFVSGFRPSLRDCQDSRMNSLIEKYIYIYVYLYVNFIYMILIKFRNTVN